MKYTIILIICLVFTQTNYAQTFEIAPFLGGSTIIGDGDSPSITPDVFVYGGILKWNRSKRHAWRISVITNYEIDHSIGEISGGLEFNFFDFNLHQSGFQHTPYVYTGVSGVIYSKNKIDNNTGDELKTRKMEVAIPLVIGYKIRVGRNFVLAAEIGPRYAFTDDLDGNDSSNPDPDGKDYSFGILGNNDWYVFSGISLSYTFGRKPCYCTN